MLHVFTELLIVSKTILCTYIWLFNILADFRGNVQVLLYNNGQEDYNGKIGDRIAQMVVVRHSSKFEECYEVDLDTECGIHEGFGSTGR